jgi:hypothetical protein
MRACSSEFPSSLLRYLALLLPHQVAYQPQNKGSYITVRSAGVGKRRGTNRESKWMLGKECCIYSKIESSELTPKIELNYRADLDLSLQ